ncbi:hypothetical protein AHF37_02608 [Paragonimus kellicotti]|nr:hypothetical protein AHF37_02608 [Paragonimus kellicotti]
MNITVCLLGTMGFTRCTYQVGLRLRLFLIPHSSGMANRTRRQVNLSDKKLCTLTFIADHTFFENVGDRNVPKTTRLIIALFYRLNTLYQSATFLIDEEVEMSGYGFLLGDIIIHESWTSRLGHYNAPSDVGGKTWTPHALSDAFNRASFNRTCLAHLLTYRPFMGVLGRAWMASSHLGGICSPSVKQGDLMIHTNTGWTTYVDHSGRRLLNAMAELITAHELGHNWGAAHDPDTTECSPPALSRGKYLMYAHSVAGFAENNYKFSPCSRRTIGATLAVRAPLCFVESSQTGYSRCGNRRLDPGEECDTGMGQDNRCCSASCKLRPHARCSPWNHECCTADCQIATASTVCAERRSSNPCLGPGRCDGLSVHCPGPTLLSNVACAEHGQCVRGQCVPHCLRHGLETCICDAAEESCYICCQFPEADSQSFLCKPVMLLHNDTSFERTVGRYSFVPDRSPPGTPISTVVGHLSVRKRSNITKHVFLHLEDYRPCATGYCMQGKCQLFKQNSILRFQGLYDKPEDRSLVANILTQLTSYEIIDAPCFRTKRWTHDSHTIREISFPVQNSTWRLILDSIEPQISPNFTVTVFGENGVRNLPINLHDLVCYTGHISSMENSSVTALLEETTNEFSARIILEDHIYFIEPLSTYAEYKGNTSMLFYRLKDLNYRPLPNVSFCGSSEKSVIRLLQNSATDAIRNRSPPGTPLSTVVGHLSVRKRSNITKHVFLHLEDYRPCATGYCMQGKCQLFKQNSILRFQGLYDKPEDRSLENFLRNNLVALVITLSLLIWVPTAVGIRISKRNKTNSNQSKTSTAFPVDGTSEPEISKPNGYEDDYRLSNLMDPA